VALWAERLAVPEQAIPVKLAAALCGVIAGRAMQSLHLSSPAEAGDPVITATNFAIRVIAYWIVRWSLRPRRRVRTMTTGQASPPLLFAARGTPSSCPARRGDFLLPSAIAKGMERRLAHQNSDALRRRAPCDRHARHPALHWRFCIAGLRRRYRLQARASGDLGSSGVTRLALSSSSELLADRS